MSKSINLPTVTINDNISNLKASSVSTDGTNTGKLARHFLDSKNANIYIKARIAVLRSKKSSLVEEIFRFHQIYQENRLVGALQLFNEMTMKHLTSLMAEFLEINQEIFNLQSQLATNQFETESSFVN